MDFSFSTTAGASQNTGSKRLKGNDIYTVKFDGCEIEDIKGVKDPSMTYRVLKLKFSNDEGSFEHTVFEPRESDFKRGENEITRDGKKEKIPTASGVENMMLLFKHAIDAINPTIAKQIDDGTRNLGAKNWEDLRKLVKQILDAGKGTTVEIKLLRNSKGDATFPGFFSGITREGKSYIRNNFIGKNLLFSTYEKSRIEKEANATPTKVSSLNVSGQLVNETNTDNKGLDFTFDTPLL